MKQLVYLLTLLLAATVYADEAQAPSVEFLEFMGEWETSDGQWQDPIELSRMNEAMDDAELQQLENEKVSEEKHNDQ